MCLFLSALEPYLVQTSTGSVQYFTISLRAYVLPPTLLCPEALIHWCPLSPLISLIPFLPSHLQGFQRPEEKWDLMENPFKTEFQILHSLHIVWQWVSSN